MASYYPPALVVQIAKVSQVFAEVDIQKNKAFKWGTKAPDWRLAMLLNMEAQSLDFIVTNYPNYAGLEKMTNYVYALCGNYVAAALRALGQGTGIIIDPSTGIPINISAFRYDFVVGTAGSPIAAGDTVYTIPLTNILPNSVLIDIVSGGSLPIGATDTISYNIVYTPNNAVVTFNQAAEDGQRYVVSGLRAIAKSTDDGGGPIIPLPLKPGQVLFNDGTNLYWGDAHISVVSADFEADGITYLNTDLADNTFDILWADIPQYMFEDSNDFTRISGGGFTVNLAGFDANANNYHLFLHIKGL